MSGFDSSQSLSVGISECLQVTVRLAEGLDLETSDVHL